MLSPPTRRADPLNGLRSQALSIRDFRSKEKATDFSQQMISLKQHFAATPFYRFLGMELIDLQDGHASVKIPFKPELTQYLSTMHGAVITAAADSAVAFALLTKVEPQKTVTTVEIKVNFLRAVKESAIVANATIVHMGRRVALGEVDVVDDNNKLVAKCLATYMIIEKAG